MKVQGNKIGKTNVALQTKESPLITEGEPQLCARILPFLFKIFLQLGCLSISTPSQHHEWRKPRILKSLISPFQFNIDIGFRFENPLNVME
ncbi:unnamed protein product [Nesidiocoris tenuis]|uniref:Uncharacterized protein n=1 Tax=Nesidiocoris tenuis TaxID=355587 RepID=A0A6H5GM57_9HEMI|nr:unnamed protein product [Nesidiocoris tenuis]